MKHYVLFHESYIIYFKAGFNKKTSKFAWSKEQIEPSFISINITVQTTIILLWLLFSIMDT